MKLNKLNIELCSECNLRCIYCDLHHKTKRTPFMDPNIYEKLLKELSEEKIFVKHLGISHSGEILCHPQFDKIINLTKHYINNGLATEKIFMNTNLMLMSPEKADFIINSGVFNWIVCSIDGKNKKSFERLRYPAKYNIAIKNFKYLVRTNNESGHKIEIDINNGNDNISINEKYDPEFAEIIENADNLFKYKFHNWTGHINNPYYIKKPNHGFCPFTFKTAVLASDGMILKCCLDLNGRTAYGNFNTSTLKDILSSNVRIKDLFKMAMYRRDLVTGCEKCNQA